MKVLTLSLVFFGELIFIYAEQLGAKSYSVSGNFTDTSMRMVVPLLVGALFLGAGYVLGTKYSHNIWVVTAVSLGSILLIEPLFNYYYMGHVPTLGAGIGFVLGVLGIVATIFL